jgi:hypothetical protein
VSEQTRKRVGWTGVGAGLVLFVAGAIAAHFTGLAATDSLGRELYPGIPRCAWFEEAGSCWVIPTSMQLLAFLGSQLAVAGILIGWIVGRPLTWARATVGAMLTTLEAIVLFGIVPNQFLSLAQGVWQWTYQKEWVTLPEWLFLNNRVSISFGVLKDIISGTYSAVLLGAVAVGAYRLQERAKRARRPQPQPVSNYGRPLVKGGR